jgi:methionyl-tRNA formyltransferase
VTPPCLLLANGRVGAEFLTHAIDSGWPVELVVLNAPPRQREADRLRELAVRADIEVLAWAPGTPGTVKDLATGRSDLWLLSVYFGHIVPRDTLAAYEGRAANLHPAPVPFGRGTHTNVWPLIEPAPAGVSLHVMTPEVDRGPVLLRKEVPIHLHDTGATLYARLEDASVELIIDAWPRVHELLPGEPQDPDGSYHEAAEFASLAEFDLTDNPEATALFNRLRALTFPPYDGLRVRLGAEVVEARIALRPTTGPPFEPEEGA